MFIPIHDANSLRHIDLHYVTIGLIAANVLVFLWEMAASAMSDGSFLAFALIPAALGDYIPPVASGAVPEPATLLTYAFFHADIWHLGGNMVFLWVFGDNVEDAVGHWRFALFYCLCAIGAGLAHTYMQPLSTAPLIGASGAVAGVIGAYLMLHPRVRVWVLALGRIPLRLPALAVLGFWILLQLWNAFAAPDAGVGWWAHIGGAATGIVLIFIMRRRGVALFDRGLGAA